MPEQHLSQQHHATFESIRQLDAAGNEFWSARQLAKVLEYSEYRHFLPVVAKAREACKLSGYVPADHIEDVLDMVNIGSGKANWSGSTLGSGLLPNCGVFTRLPSCGVGDNNE